MSNAIRTLPALVGILLTLPVSAHAGFIDDSQATLLLRNFYYDRDIQDAGAGQSQLREWAQGFMLDVRSGYTAGAVGFGLDLSGALGLKLDSSAAHAGTGLLPNAWGDSGPGEYSKLGAAAKVRYAGAELRIGDLRPRNPLLQSGDVRLLPHTFRGADVRFDRGQGWSLQGGQVRQVNYRNSTNYQDIRAANFAGESDRFSYLGGRYDYAKAGNLGLWHARLDDIYQQTLVQLEHRQPLGKGALGLKLGVFDSDDQGRRLAGAIDNRLTSLSLFASHSGHQLLLGYQKNRGDSAFPFILETDPNVIGLMQVLNFTRAKEQAWQVRYDLDFAALGVPGLSLFTRYMRGDGFTSAGRNGQEWERDLDVSYTLQSGPLKNLAVRWRNASIRSSSAGKFDENRLILNYSIPLL